MSERGIKSFMVVCLSVVGLFIIISMNSTIEIAWSIINNLTHFVPFIITGTICILLGISERKFGSLIFVIISIVLLGISLW